MINNNKKAFTLLEILVALTIFSIFMVSMIMIYASSANIDRKIDINRAMQENSKNIIETIAEDIRKNGIKGASKEILDNCDFTISSGLYKKGDKLCTNASIYYLAMKNMYGAYTRVASTEIQSKCGDIKNECVLVKDNGSGPTRLSNSSVKFTDLKFLVSDKGMPKVTIIFEMQPSIRKGIKADTIKNSKMNFQTTITSRIIKTN